MNIKKVLPAALVVLAAAVCLLWILLFNMNAGTGNSATIKVGGAVVNTVNLNDNTTVNVQGKNDIQLKVVVDNGEIYVEHSDCPDKICVYKGRISKVNENIICLPAETIIEIQGDSKEEFDVSV